MKKKFMNWKGFRILTSVLMSLLLLMGTVQAVAASGENENNRTTGSLSLTLEVTEHGEQVPLPNVSFALYQVADMDTEPAAYFHLASSLYETGVDLNHLKTAADAESAVKTLADAIASAGIVPLTGTTDTNGNLFFDSLPKGAYLLVQTGAFDFCRVSTMLVSVPYIEEDQNYTYDVQAFPKVEKTIEPTPTPETTPTPEATPTPESTPTPKVTPGTTPGVTPGTTSHRVNTGDNTPILLWLAILLAAAGLIGVAVTRRNKK